MRPGANDVRAEIVSATGNAAVRVFVADLSSQADVRRLAERWSPPSRGSTLLVHCAGVFTSHRTLTADGLETMFATNQLAPFLLTNLLRDHLVASAPARC